MGTSVLQRVTKYQKKQVERGMVVVKVWVPTESRQQLIDFAEKLRSATEQSPE